MIIETKIGSTIQGFDIYTSLFDAGEHLTAFMRERNYIRVRNTAAEQQMFQITDSDHAAAAFVEKYEMAAGQEIYIEINELLQYLMPDYGEDKLVSLFISSQLLYEENLKIQLLYGRRWSVTNRQVMPPVIYVAGGLPFYVPCDNEFFENENQIMPAVSVDKIGGKRPFQSVLKTRIFQGMYIGSDVDFPRCFELREVEGGEDPCSVCQLYWIGQFGLWKSWAFFIEEQRETGADAVSLQTWQGYDVRRTGASECTVVFRGADYKTQAYLADIVSSCEVRFVSYEYMTQISADHFETADLLQVGVKDTEFAVTEGRRDVSLTIQLLDYGADIY